MVSTWYGLYFERLPALYLFFTFGLKKCGDYYPVLTVLQCCPTISSRGTVIETPYTKQLRMIALQKKAAEA